MRFTSSQPFQPRSAAALTMPRLMRVAEERVRSVAAASSTAHAPQLFRSRSNSCSSIWFLSVRDPLQHGDAIAQARDFLAEPAGVVAFDRRLGRDVSRADAWTDVHGAT
jgi:hypothetical protein